MPTSTKYLKFGLRSDRNLSDLTNTSTAISSILDDISVQTFEDTPKIKSFDGGSNTVVNESNDQITISGHGFSTGDEVVYSCTGATDVTPTALSPLVSGTTYFVIKVSDTVIKLASNLANANSGSALDFTTTTINAATDGASNHKLFKVTNLSTGFISDDLTVINGLSLTGLGDRTEKSTPLGQSLDLLQLSSMAKTFIRSSDNTTLNISPRITLNDQIENYKSIVGSPPFVEGGDGPLAFIVPSDRVNSAIPSDVTGSKANNPPSTIGTSIYSEVFDTTLTDIVGPVDFWDTGRWRKEGNLSKDRKSVV